jgi:hypothetical protein
MRGEQDQRRQPATAARLDEMECGVFTMTEAARYLRMSVRSIQDRPDIPRHDCRAPGTRKAMWRYLRGELDAWIARRTYGGNQRGWE